MTTDAIADVSKFLHESINRRSKCMGVLFDLVKAFGTVKHQLVLC